MRKDQTGWVPHLSWKQAAAACWSAATGTPSTRNHWGDVLWAEGFAAGRRPAPSGSSTTTTPATRTPGPLFANERWEVGRRPDPDWPTCSTSTSEYDFRAGRGGQLHRRPPQRLHGRVRLLQPQGRPLTGRRPGRSPAARCGVYGTWACNHREPTDSELFDTWQGARRPGRAAAVPRQPRGAGRRRHGGLRASGPIPWSSEERVVDYELGLAWRTADRVSVHLNGYWMDFKNEIVPYGGVDDDGSSIRGNADQTLHRGLELGLHGAPGPATHAVRGRLAAAGTSSTEFIFHRLGRLELTTTPATPSPCSPTHLLARSAGTADWPAVRDAPAGCATSASSTWTTPATTSAPSTPGRRRPVRVRLDLGGLGAERAGRHQRLPARPESW